MDLEIPAQELLLELRCAAVVPISILTGWLMADASKVALRSVARYCPTAISSASGYLLAPQAMLSRLLVGFEVSKKVLVTRWVRQTRRSPGLHETKMGDPKGVVFNKRRLREQTRSNPRVARAVHRVGEETHS